MPILCSTDDFQPDSAQGFEFNGRNLVVVHKDGAFFVYVNSCPHIGIPLEFQPDEFLDTDKQFIQCANHGALFEIESGFCVAGPCHGKSLEPVSFELKDGKILI